MILGCTQSFLCFAILYWIKIWRWQYVWCHKLLAYNRLNPFTEPFRQWKRYRVYKYHKYNSTEFNVQMWCAFLGLDLWSIRSLWHTPQAALCEDVCVSPLHMYTRINKCSVFQNSEGGREKRGELSKGGWVEKGMCLFLCKVQYINAAKQHFRSNDYNLSSMFSSKLYNIIAPKSGIFN